LVLLKVDNVYYGSAVELIKKIVINNSFVFLPGGDIFNKHKHCFVPVLPDRPFIKSSKECGLLHN
jgi:hypothetical protein